MAAPTPIVLVTGPPASGKTFVAAILAEDLRLPLIEKDAIKETLFDTLGTGDGARSQQLGRATFALIRWAVETHLKARRPVIVEANLSPEDARPALRELAERHPFMALELHCTAAPDVLMARYCARAGSRHPGHLDEQKSPQIAAAIAAGRYGPLRLDGGDCVVVDTTSFHDLDTDALLATARAHLAGAEDTSTKPRPVT